MGWLEDSGSGLRGAAAREARKERLKERQKEADIQVEKIDGAAAREARKRKLQEKEAEEGLAGAALRQKRKERQAAKEQEEKRLKEEREKKRLHRLAKVKGKAPGQDENSTGEVNLSDLEAERQKRLAEKIAARRAAMQQNEAIEEGDGEDEDGEEEATNESSEEDQADDASSGESAEKLKSKTSTSKKKTGSSSSSETQKKKKKKTDKKKKKKKKKKNKKSSSSSISSGPSEEAMEIAKTLAMQNAGSFSWERKLEDGPTITDFNVLASAATFEEVENFIRSSCTMDPTVVQRFRNLPPPIQKLVIDRGPINNSLTPSNVLGARCRDAEMGKFGLPGQEAPPENPKIEALIKKYDLDINCAHRMRHESLRIQKAILALHKDIEACSNPSGLIMAKLNEYNPPSKSSVNHTGLQIVYR